MFGAVLATLLSVVAALTSLPSTGPPPEPLFTRQVQTQTTLDGVTKKLDACDGPVSVSLGAGWPTLVAEHDYCGGDAWIPGLDNGDAVKLSGKGVDTGVYVVREIRFDLRGEAMVKDLPDTDVVLQTCVTEKKVILVGLDRWR